MYMHIHINSKTAGTCQVNNSMLFSVRIASEGLHACNQTTQITLA